MARIYLSSTYADLVTFREAVYHTLRQLSHDVIAMEHYVAADQRPLSRCLTDVAGCDVYVGIFAWRYGYIPEQDNPAGKSITELEYRQAEALSIPRLIFLLDENTVWLPKLTDAMSGAGASGRLITELRKRLSTEHLVSFFKTEDELAKLVSIAVRNLPPLQLAERRPPQMAERPPADFVQRSKEFTELLELLLQSQRTNSVAVTIALQGAGGYGKTTLAKALCHDPCLQQGFKDGILWVTLGGTPGDLTSRIEELIYALSSQRPGFTNAEAAAARLAELLAGRDVLLVIDDVWNSAHLRPFLQGGERCARLITTRNLDTLPPSAQKIKVDAMANDEAIMLLASGIQYRDHKGEEPALHALAHRLGEWPLLLKLVNSALRDQIENTNSTLDEALAYVNEALDRRGLTHFDARNRADRSQAVAQTISVSLELLHETEAERYAELAVFPKDVDVPLCTLEKFWRRTGGLDKFDTIDLCARLNRLSLLLSYDVANKRIRLHDVIRTYLIEQQKNKLPALHAHLLAAHHPGTVWAALPDTEPYFWEQLAFHLLAAGRSAELEATVKDWRYLVRKTLSKKALAVETDLVQAEKVAPTDNVLRTLRRNYVNSGHLFNHCATPDDLAATLFARLQHLGDLQTMLQDLAANLAAPHITPKFALPDLPHPALIRTLEGHTDWVRGCALSGDGRLIVSASASNDSTLKVWETATGLLLRTLEGHADAVNDCVLSNDDHLLISASEDGTLKMWEIATGKLLRTLEGHADGVNSCALSGDDRLLVSASDDGTLKVWEVGTGALVHTLKGHSSVVMGCALNGDGQLLVSASGDSTLKVWKTATGNLLHTLEGHAGGVNGCALSSDGRLLVSASDDGTLKVWEAGTGVLLHTLKGHSRQVMDCVLSKDGSLLVSASFDRTLKVWETATGVLLCTLEGHSDRVNGCAISSDGQLLVSASYDGTLKVWEAATKAAPLTQEGHADVVSGCAISGDGRLIVSASDDGTLRIWAAATGASLRMLEDRASVVSGCAINGDGRLLVSASDDGTLKVWETTTGALLRTLKGHSNWVRSCAISGDGRLVVSASGDRTLTVWETATGALLHTLRGHSGRMRSCALSEDGQLLVSASADSTLKVWETATGALLHTLEGHLGRVTGCALSRNGRLVVSASDDRTLKVWEAATGALLRTLEGHSAGIRGCAMSADGQLFVSASADRTLKVWAAGSGNCLATFYADAPLLCCAMHGEMIVAGGARWVYFLKLVQ